MFDLRSTNRDLLIMFRYSNPFSFFFHSCLKPYRSPCRSRHIVKEKKQKHLNTNYYTWHIDSRLNTVNSFYTCQERSNKTPNCTYTRSKTEKKKKNGLKTLKIAPTEVKICNYNPALKRVRFLKFVCGNWCSFNTSNLSPHLGCSTLQLCPHIVLMRKHVDADEDRKTAQHGEQEKCSLPHRKHGEREERRGGR